MSISWCNVPFPQLFTFSLEGKSLKCESDIKIPSPYSLWLRQIRVEYYVIPYFYGVSTVIA